jgi:phospholipid transport system substrate-binding protein
MAHRRTRSTASRDHTGVAVLLHSRDRSSMFKHSKAALVAVLFAVSLGGSSAWAQAEAPDALVKRVSTDVLDAVKADPSIQAGDVGAIVALVNTKILPYFDFERMTASAAGPAWRTATPEQKAALQEQFKILLIRVYSGALSRARDRTIALKPMRDAATDPEVIVRTEVRGNGDPVELDFRLYRTASGWRIYDMNVGGVWLVENYRSTFAQEIDSGGIDGLVAKLIEKNRAAARS